MGEAAGLRGGPQALGEKSRGTYATWTVARFANESYAQEGVFFLAEPFMEGSRDHRYSGLRLFQVAEMTTGGRQFSREQPTAPPTLDHILVRLEGAGERWAGESARLPEDPYYLGRDRRELLAHARALSVAEGRRASMGRRSNSSSRAYAPVKGKHFRQSGGGNGGLGSPGGAHLAYRSRRFWEVTRNGRRPAAVSLRGWKEGHGKKLLSHIAQHEQAGYRPREDEDQPWQGSHCCRGCSAALSATAPSWWTRTPPYAPRKTRRHWQCSMILDLMMIEQPLAWDDFVDHAKLQDAHQDAPSVSTKSIRSIQSMRTAIALEACKIVNVKIGRLGGPAFRPSKCMMPASPPGSAVWCGRGMHDYGVGRSANLALSSLSGVHHPRRRLRVRISILPRISSSRRSWRAGTALSRFRILQGSGTISTSNGCCGGTVRRAQPNQRASEDVNVADSHSASPRSRYRRRRQAMRVTSSRMLHEQVAGPDPPPTSDRRRSRPPRASISSR